MKLNINVFKFVTICSIFILIFSCNICLANTSISESKFKNIITSNTNILESDLDFENYTYSSNTNYNAFNTCLTYATYNKYLAVGDENFENTDTCLTYYLIRYSSSSSEYYLGFKNNNNILYFYGRNLNGAANSYYLDRYVIDTKNKTINKTKGSDTDIKSNYLSFNNFDISEEQFNSNDWQKIQYWNMFIYSDNDFFSTNLSVINNTWDGRYLDNFNDSAGGLVSYNYTDNYFTNNFLAPGSTSGDFRVSVDLQTLDVDMITSADDQFGYKEKAKLNNIAEYNFNNVSSFYIDLNLKDIDKKYFDTSHIYRINFKTFSDDGEALQNSYSMFFSFRRIYITSIIIEDFSAIYTDLPSNIYSGDTSSGNDIISSIVGTGDGVENTGIVGSILRGIKSLFIPDNDYFQKYWDDLYYFFKTKLGFLWECFMFVPNLLQAFEDAVESNLDVYDITIPSLSIPTFMGDDSEITILESFTWSPYEYIKQNSAFVDLYALYLNLMDFLVFWALMNQCINLLANILGFYQDKEIQESIERSGTVHK